MNRIEKVFVQAREENRALFIGYLCAGDPDFECSLEACRTVIDSGVDLLEIGIPFSDPLADGLTNQLASQRALETGSSFERVFDLIRAIRAFSEVPLVAYTYYNLVFAKGSEEYIKSAKAAGLDGILTLDLPPEEATDYLQACAKFKLKTVFIVAPTTPISRFETICKATTGFIYYVSREGVTGEQESVSDDIAEQVNHIREYTDLPVVVGFGISKPEHVHTVAQAADGVVVGSAIVNCIAQNLGDPKAIAESLRAKVGALLKDDALLKK